MGSSCEIESNGVLGNVYVCNEHRVYWDDTIWPSLCPVATAAEDARREERAEVGRNIDEHLARQARALSTAEWDEFADGYRAALRDLARDLDARGTDKEPGES